MANITAAMVKDLREKTGAGMMDCKTALGESSGDMEAAVDWLRKKGLSKAAKKAGRVAAEGLIGQMLAPKKTIDELNAMGHGVIARESIGDVNALMLSGAKIIAVADPRHGGAAGGH